MQKWGKTRKGNIRWYCPNCHTTQSRTRTDVGEAYWKRYFLQWITTKKSMTDVAKEAGVFRTTLSVHCARLWDTVSVQPRMMAHADNTNGVVIVDGMFYEGRTHVVLIARTAQQSCIGYSFVNSESFQSWHGFFSLFPRKPSVIVCDGRAGLIRAARQLFPGVIIQRCLVHIQQGMFRFTTRRPKSPAMKAMFLLAHSLTSIRTLAEKEKWIHSYHTWQFVYAEYINAKTRADIYENENKQTKRRTWWYTHRSARALQSLIENALPDMFHYLITPGVPHHSNHMEGGVNARLQEMIRCHRGMITSKKQQMLALLLGEKMTQKG